MSIEKWVPVVGYENLYEVSSEGRVRRIYRHPLRPNEKLPYYLKLTPNQKGYIEVSLHGRSIKVHKIVLEAFSSKKPDGLECLHKDGNRSNNRFNNLRWGTAKENSKDRAVHGRWRPHLGSKHPNSKLNEKSVLEIRASALSNRELAKHFGVSTLTIWEVKREKKWRHVKSEQFTNAVDGKAVV